MVCVHSIEEAVRWGGGVTNVCITNNMLKAVWTAARNNRERLEAERQKEQKEAEEKQKVKEAKQKKNSEVQQLNAGIVDASWEASVRRWP